LKTKRIITSIDSHTCAETTRFLIGGFPKIKGETMWEKTKYFQKHFDHLRKAVALRPRGFTEILGSILTEPCNPKADAGIIYYHAGGFWEACGDSTFSSCKILLELGIVEKQEPVTEIKLDTAGGLLRCKANVKDGVVGYISYEAVPSFFQESLILDVENLGKLHADVSYGGLWYAIVDSEEASLVVSPKNAEQLVQAGMAIIDAANRQVKVIHPLNPDLDKITIMEFSSKPALPEHDYKHCNVFGIGSLCVSPAGTSVSAKLAAKVAKGELEMGEEIVVESPANPELLMKGKAVRKVKVGKFNGIIPELTARPFITGINQWIIEEDDPIAYGFHIGKYE
jgi:proline racemase